MNDLAVHSNKKMPKVSATFLLLGIVSLVILVVFAVLGFVVERIGVVSIFGIVSVVAIAATICGIAGRKKSIAGNLPGKNTATVGLILGAVALFLTIFFRIAILLFFIPWIGA